MTDSRWLLASKMVDSQQRMLYVSENDNHSDFESAS